MAVATLMPALSERDHTKGAANASIELVEYGDFECPHCQRAATVVNQLTEEFGDRLRFAFRHFPLAKMHPHARKAAQAAEAAAAIGGNDKFWQMHDLLFANASALSISDLHAYAATLDLDMPEFEKALEAETYASRVQEDVASGVRSGVNGTPTFFINGQRHNGGYDLDALRAGLVAASGTS